MSLIPKELDKSPKTIEDLYKYNAELADEIYGSAFYYGNFTEEEWIQRMTMFLNKASERGYNLRKSQFGTYPDNFDIETNF